MAGCLVAFTLPRVEQERLVLDRGFPGGPVETEQLDRSDSSRSRQRPRFHRHRPGGDVMEETKREVVVKEI